jgi:hypothetical protein
VFVDAGIGEDIDGVTRGGRTEDDAGAGPSGGRRGNVGSGGGLAGRSLGGGSAAIEH